MIVTGEYIKDAVCAQIAKEFENLHRYTEGQKQNFKRPAVVISQIHTSQNQLLGHRYLRTYRIRIHFFPHRKDPTPKEVCDRYGNWFAEVFRILHITDDFSVHGRNIEFEIVEDVLHFNVDFKIRLDLQLPKIPKLWTLDLETHIKK